MIKIKILTPNKTKEKWLEEAINQYIKRLKQTVEISFVIAKDDEMLTQLAQKEAYIIALDRNGMSFTSPSFSNFLFQSIEESGARIAFVIGGPEGLPKELKQTKHLISFSKMTFTHQVIRLILVEQIYRAFEIARGSQYHK